METPAGFTKVAVGKYTKGEYTYIVNPTTGAVSAKKTSEAGEEDEDLEYLKSYLIGADLQEIMDMSNGTFTDPNVTIDMAVAEDMSLD